LLSEEELEQYEDDMVYRVQRGTNIYEFDKRKEAVDYAREISETGEAAMFYETTLAREQLNYKNGELISFRSENIKRGR
jgi:hypothetical protein